MLSTNTNDISITLRLIGAALASGLIKKEEVIDWADKIITTTENPGIFFIELAMAGKKTAKEVLHDVNSYDSAYKPVLPVRPFLGMLYKQHKQGAFTLAQTIQQLFDWVFEKEFSPLEETRIYMLDNSYHDAFNGIYGSIADVQNQLDQFLSAYKDYSFDNIEQWPALDKIVDDAL